MMGQSLQASGASFADSILDCTKAFFVSINIVANLNCHIVLSYHIFSKKLIYCLIALLTLFSSIAMIQNYEEESYVVVTRDRKAITIDILSI